MEKEYILNELRYAYARQNEQRILYCGVSVTASEKLNALPFWHYMPTNIIATHSKVNFIGNAMIAQSFSCEPLFTSSGKEWLKPIITDIDDLKKVVKPNIYDTKAGEVLRAAEELKCELDEQGNDTKIVVPDTAAPLSIAELMWDHTFYEYLADDEAAVHGLLQKITDFTIEFTLEFQRITGDRYAPCAWPGVWSEGAGCYLGDDAMSLVSPKTHLELSVPYINQISAACGGIYYHSCSWYEQYFDNISKIENVKLYNWNPGNSTDSALILREFGGRAVLAPHIAKNMHQDSDIIRLGQNYADEFELFKYLYDNIADNSAVIFYLSDICSDKEMIERFYEALQN